MIIVDNFYADPHAMRKFAIGCNYKESQDAWPGLKSEIMCPNSRETLFRISDLVSDRRPNWNDIEASYKFWGEAPCGGFQALNSDHSSPGVIHTHRKGHYTGIIFLTLPEHCTGRKATSFYKHKEHNIRSYLEIDDVLFERIKQDAYDHSMWELIETAEMVFNRLVVFDSRNYHTWSPGFGTSLSDCRLTHIFNFTTEK